MLVRGEVRNVKTHSARIHHQPNPPFEILRDGTHAAPQVEEDKGKPILKKAGNWLAPIRPPGFERMKPALGWRHGTGSPRPGLRRHTGGGLNAFLDSGSWA